MAKIDYHMQFVQVANPHRTSLRLIRHTQRETSEKAFAFCIDVIFCVTVTNDRADFLSIERLVCKRRQKRDSLVLVHITGSIIANIFVTIAISVMIVAVAFLITTKVAVCSSPAAII